MSGTPRHFTVADVIAKVLSLTTNVSGPTLSVKVVAVELLYVVERPIWRVDIIHEYSDGRRYNLCSLLTERGPATARELGFITGMPLPEGASSVEEEDQLLAERTAQS